MNLKKIINKMKDKIIRNIRLRLEEEDYYKPKIAISK